MRQIRKPLSKSNKGKYAVVAAMLTGAALITGSGAWFAVYSTVNHVSFRFMNSSVPGVVLAVLVTYFGVRYFISVYRLSKEIMKDSSFFSWGNFRRAKTAKSR